MHRSSPDPRRRPLPVRAVAIRLLAVVSPACAVVLALSGCGGSAQEAAPVSAQAPAASSAPSSAPSSESAPAQPASTAAAGGADLCAQLPLDRLNTVLDEVGDPVASTAPAGADGGPSCLLTGADPAHAYVVTLHDQPFDDVLAGRASLDTTAGPRSAWVDEDHVLLEDLGGRTLTVARAQGSDVGLADVLPVASAVTGALP